MLALSELLSVASLSGRCGLSLDQPSVLELATDDKEKCTMTGGKGMFSPENSQLLAETVNGKAGTNPCKETVRTSGIVLMLIITYENTELKHCFSSGKPCWNEVDYYVSVKAIPLSQAEIERASLTSADPDDRQAKYEGRHGVLLLIQQDGKLGRFSFMALLLNFTAGLTLVLIANSITLVIAKNICPLITKDRRYRDLIIQESPDFNEEQEGGETYQEMEDGKGGGGGKKGELPDDHTVWFLSHPMHEWAKKIEDRVRDTEKRQRGMASKMNASVPSAGNASPSKQPGKKTFKQ